MFVIYLLLNDLMGTRPLTQGYLYIKPLSSKDDCDPAPTVMCFNCKLDVSINDIRQHQQSCYDDDELYVLFLRLKY